MGKRVFSIAGFRHYCGWRLYKIMRTLPVESKGGLTYRIKSAVEKFERTADESEFDARGLNEIHPASDSCTIR